MLKKFIAQKGILKWTLITLTAAAAITVFSISSTAEVMTELVGKGDIKEMIELQGKVELNENEKIYARLEGFIDEIYVYAGDEVDEDSKLIQLSVDNVEFAISKAEAAYSAASAQLESLKRSIRPEHIKLAEAELEKAKAMEKAALCDYTNKQYNFENIKVLYANGAISEKEMKDTELLAAVAEGYFRSAEQVTSMAQYNLDIAMDGVLKEEIRAAEANVRIAKVQLDELIYNKGKTNVCSSIRGIVMSKEVDKDQAVSSGTLMYEIGNYDSAYIKVDVLVDDISNIKIGQKVVISGDVINDDEINGEVYYIAPKALSKVSSLGVEQQRIEVRIRFDNSSLKLKPGYTLDVDITTKEKQDTLYISDKAVFTMDGKEAVFVVKKGKLVIQSIEIGIENDDYIEVVSGLSEGDMIVVDPDSKLKPGKRVKSQK